jgi:hypothetical protein
MPKTQPRLRTDATVVAIAERQQGPNNCPASTGTAFGKNQRIGLSFPAPPGIH